MISFRERNNINPDKKPEKRRCVYCGEPFKTIGGRLCCRICGKSEEIAEERWQMLLNKTKQDKEGKDKQ
jgi:hypothetical protein